MSEVQAVKIASETPSSVEITRNARGTVQWSVKVYCAAGDEREAMRRAIALEGALKVQYRDELPS